LCVIRARVAEGWEKEGHEKQSGGYGHHSGAEAASVGRREAGDPRENRATESCSEKDPARVGSATAASKEACEDEGIGRGQGCAEEEHGEVANG
jgi:hypothetical protein